MSKIKSYNYTKKEISKKIHSKIGFSAQYIEEITNDLLDLLKKRIKENKLNIKNFGKFKLIFKNERIGRNPKNKKKYKINSRYSLSFIPSKKLNDKVNN